nr:scavenger receptor class B member 1-like isoform X2 [Onthophagus taurus]
MVHTQYLHVGQNARNRLFGIDPHGTNIQTRLQLLISQPSKTSSSKIAVIIFGLATLIIGIVLSSIPWLDYIILKHLRLWNGSLSYHYWQKPGVLRLTKVYIFNMTNPEEFLNLGEKPKLQEVGPFVYREDMEKVNVKFHDNGTVTFQHNKILKFVPEMSKPKDLKLTVPNIPLLSLSTMSNSLGFFLQKTISVALSFGRYKPFINLTAEELVFGYDDTLVTLAHEFYPKHKKPNGKMGLLLGRNGTLNEISTIFTGETSMEEFGYIDNVNGLRTLPYWKDAPCNNIRASEGSFFPPRYFSKDKEQIYYLYDKDVCRLIPLQYRKTEAKSGITVDLYTPADNMYESVENYPENKCFCPGNEYCPPSGLQSIIPCHHDAPIYASFPHFYKGDPHLLDQIQGLSPSEKDHGSYIKIQPKLGVPLEALIRLQVNLKVERAPNVAVVSKFPSIILPLMWIEEGVTDLTPTIKRWIYLATTFADVMNPLATYGSILVGTCILVGVFINAYKSIMFTRDTIEMSMRTLRRGSNLIQSNNNRLLIIRDSYTLLNDVPETPDALDSPETFI